MISVEQTQTLYLGRVGEQNVEPLPFDIAPWIAKYGQGVTVLTVKRACDSVPYPVDIVTEGNVVTWTVSKKDVESYGTGKAELTYMVDDKIKKSVVYKTYTEKSLADITPTPENGDTWLDAMTKQVLKAEGHSTQSESYAHGGTGARVDEDTDNAQYYYEKTKDIAENYVPGGGGTGTSDYSKLNNKPSINGHELNGNQTAEQLGLQPKGNYLTQHQDISGKADKTEIPTKVSQLQNDKGYLTEHQSLADYAKKTELPTKTSQLANDSNYQNGEQVQNTVNQAIKGVTQFEYEKVSVLPLTGVKGKIYLVASAETADKNIYDEYIWVDTAFELIGTTKIDLSGYVTDTQLEEKLKTKLNTTDISEWAKSPTKPTYTAKEVGALPEGTVVPTKTSELKNDSGFLTEHQDISGKLDKNQGSQNNGKILGIDAQGNVVPVVKPSGGGTAKLEPLTFTGGATGTYDGSEPVTIPIPTGGGGGTQTLTKIIDKRGTFTNTQQVDIPCEFVTENSMVCIKVKLEKAQNTQIYVNKMLIQRDTKIIDNRNEQEINLFFKPMYVILNEQTTAGFLEGYYTYSTFNINTMYDGDLTLNKTITYGTRKQFGVEGVTLWFNSATSGEYKVFVYK